MTTLRHDSVLWQQLARRIALMGTLLLGLTVLPAGALDISGTYADKGTVVTSEVHRPASAVSFHGLLNLNFDPDAARHDFAPTSHLTLTQGRALIDLLVFNKQDAVIGRGSMDYEPALAPTGEEVVVLRFRAPAFGEDTLVFSLSPVPEHGLLQVTIVRAVASNFGPLPRPVGTYWFERLREP